MKKLLSMFLLSCVVIQTSDSVGVAGGGASSGVLERIHDQESIVPSNQFTLEQEALLKKYRTTNLVVAIDYTEMNREEKAIGNAVLDSILGKQMLLCTKSVFLSMNKAMEGFFASIKGYICKEVNDDYVLFVPEAMQHNDQPAHVRNALVGLKFSELPDYDHTVVDGNEFDKVKEKSLSVAFGDSGKKLLEVLLKLKITDVSPELLPYFNFFLSGHGGPGVIADISAKSPAANKPSDFLKVMQLFDKSFRTKSVGIFSCYLGGKQNIDTYSMYDQDGRPVFNKYNNALLEDLSYSIINFGSLHQYLFSKVNIDQYFQWLNEEVPAYEKILNQVRQWAIDNWVSIKLPHTSWFSPVELKNKSQTLSQVAMSTRETAVDIKPETEVIILQANYISRPVAIHGNQGLSFLPVNYHNQSYYFKSLRITGQANSTIFEALNSLIFNNVRVSEEINFAFERLQINNVIYKNVHCFVSKFDNYQRARTGFIYEDPQGKVFEYSWPAQNPSDIAGKKAADIKIDDHSVIEKSLPREAWAQEFRDLSDSIQDKISESLQPDLINRLEKTLPVSKAKKVIVGKSLYEIADQLSKKLLKSEDLKSVIPVLESEIRNTDIAVQQQVKTIFDQLIKSHVITSNNLKILQPLLIKTFTSSLGYVHTQANVMIHSLINKGIINSNNWHVLMPTLKAGVKNSNLTIKLYTVLLLRLLVDSNLILYLSSIKSLLVTGIQDSNPLCSEWYADIIKRLISLNVVTKSDIEYFKNLAPTQKVKDLLESFKVDASKIIQDKVPVDQLTKLLVSLNKDISAGISFDNNKMTLLQELLLETKVDKLSPLIGQLLPVLEKTLDHSDLSVKNIANTIFDELITKKLITTDDVDKILPFIEKNMNHSDKYHRFMWLNKLINSHLITEDKVGKILPLIETEISDSDEDVRFEAILMLDSLIYKNLITSENVDKILPLIEKGMSDVDEYTVQQSIKDLDKLITKNLITAESAERLEPLVNNQEIKAKLQRLQNPAMDHEVGQSQNLHSQQLQEDEGSLDELQQEYARAVAVA